MKILIAEDSQTHRYWLQEILIELGHDVTIACDGTEAWQALSQESAPPLVISDWIMPGMNGVEVCQKFRKTYGFKPTYIILLTGKISKRNSPIISIAVISMNGEGGFLPLTFFFRFSSV